MRVASVNVGLPREVSWNGKTVVTGIFKSPVASSVTVRRTNLDGDGQADLTVHGGAEKAVYGYPAEHYAFWAGQLRRELTPGNFGENLTTEGLLEDAVCIGDEFRMGTARLVVTQPRLPCFKLGIRFDDPAMVKAFVHAGKPGIYFAVLEEGTVGPGDPIERVVEDASRITVAEMFRLVLDHDADPAELRRLLGVPALAAYWRTWLHERLGT
ncbi:MAG: MOSC domain-containing protein [Isosphaeraceae bacterium]